MSFFTTEVADKQGKSVIFIEPSINFRKEYKIKAHVDTVNLRVLLDRKTQHQHLRAKLHQCINERTTDEITKVYTRATNGNSNQGATGWVIKIEDPTAKEVRDAIESIRTTWGLSEHVTIERLDVALDFPLKGPNELKKRTHLMRTLAACTAGPVHLRNQHSSNWSLWNPRIFHAASSAEHKKNIAAIKSNTSLSDNFRQEAIKDIENEKKQATTSARFALLTDKFTAGGDHTLYWGNKERTFYKLYDKVTVTDPFVRFEVSLFGEDLHALGLIKADDLFLFDFHKLLKDGYLKFHLPAVPAASAGETIQNDSGEVIVHCGWNKEMAGLILKQGFTGAIGFAGQKGSKPSRTYTELNNVICEKLGTLSGHWGKC